MLVKEPLNGGVVQTRHPLLLRPGEVQEAIDCILKPGDPSLQTAPGRSLYGTVRSSALTCVTNATTALTSTAAFGTDIATVTVTTGSNIISKASAFGAVVQGMTVVGTGIPAGTIVSRVIDTSTIKMNKNATSTGTPTVTFSNLHPGTFISGSGITTGTTISSITSASALTMSLVATNSISASRTFSEEVEGLRALVYDDVNDDVLLAKASDSLYSSPLIGLTGSFTQLLSGLSQEDSATLETIQYGDSHIVLTGFDIPRLIQYKDNGSGAQALIGRALGMKPVVDFVGVTPVAGSWSSLSSLGNGWYWFLVTEVYNPGQTDESEGTYNGVPKSAHITDYNTQSILITKTVTAGSANAANNGIDGANTATHWRVYMSPKNGDPYPQSDLSTFRQVAEVPITLASVTLADVNPYQQGWAAAVATYSGYDTLFPYDSAPALSSVAAQSVASTTTTINVNIITSASGFGTVTTGMWIIGTGIPIGTTVQEKTSSSSLKLSANATANGTVTVYFGNKPTWDNVSGIVPPNTANYRAGEFRNFGIQNQGSFSGGTITGIRVEINGQWAADNDNGDDRGFYISLIKGGSTTSVERWISFVQGSYRSGIMGSGGQQDNWGISWVPADFIDGAATFGVRLRKHSSAVNQGHYIDGVKVIIYAGGNSINLDGAAFETVIISDQIGNSVGVGAAGAPPVASTGDIIDGIVVMNDTNDPSSLVGCLPDNIEGWPDPYRLPLEGRENDKVRVVRRLGASGGVIGCENSVKRLNYFPRETDAEFSRGRCYEDIATDHGMVGPRAAVHVTLPGRGTVLVYLSFVGLHWTDAVTTTRANTDLDWNNLIEPTLIHKSVLEVYPRYSVVALYYVPVGATRRTKVIYFSYDSTHMKADFKMPAVGPVGCESGAAAGCLLTGRPRLFTGHSMDGKVYVEDSGTTDASGGTILPSVKTRRFFASELGREGRVAKIFCIADAAGDATTGGFTAELYRQNQNEAVTLANTITDASTLYGGIIELFPDDTLETFEMKFYKGAPQTAAIKLHIVSFSAPDMGEDTN